MKIPDTHYKRALIVIGLQPAFIKPHNQHIVPNIISLIKNISYGAYVEAIFHAKKGSLWDTQVVKGLLKTHRVDTLLNVYWAAIDAEEAKRNPQ